jgi:hypothetical protein
MSDGTKIRGTADLAVKSQNFTIIGIFSMKIKRKMAACSSLFGTNHIRYQLDVKLA